ncbi:hypothetical protein [Streptomyces sp. NPDC001594]|uniref:hypothetical protein n=1 Tax=Streptomyces sp. NPDC001594 TaxID=3364590 RepID=UPI0036967C46
MATDDLFARALDEIGMDEGPAPCLVALHGRPTRHVFEGAVGLLACEEPAKRELGARILRELGPYDTEGRRPFTPETIEAVLREIPGEPDPGVLSWLISVLGYHNARETLDLVLGYQGHTAQPVRFAVAAALPSLADPERTQDRVVEALLKLSEDEDEAVRWYALYALFQETVAVTDEQRTEWARALIKRGDGDRRAQLHHLGTTLDNADTALRAVLELAPGT